MRTANWLLGTALAAIMIGSVAMPVAAQEQEETRAEHDARMAWWRQAKFGMFIHWGLYAVPAGTYKGKQIGGIGEWIMRRAPIPVTDYREYAKEFNPVKYDPAAWAALAKEAGMKYMVITSKHHDGFTLFPSKASTWNVADATPYGKDLIGPLAKAARAEGLKFGLYYSQAQDWNNPGGAKSGMKDGEGWCDEHKGSFDDYLKAVAIPQVREILTTYHPDILWWDTPHLMTPERAAPLHALLALRPGIITNNRLGGGYRGDTETPEQHIPATGYKDRDWETCMTMNGTWGYKSYDHNWKSVEILIRNLVDIVSKGGNYLLNVGPTAEGEIPQPSIERLKAVGKWMEVNGDAIYGTTASPCRRPAWGRVTTKHDAAGTTLYLHVFDWPKDGELLLPVANAVESCKLLADPGRKLSAAAGERGVTVKLTGEAPDPICSVIALRIKGAPEAVGYRIPQRKDGSVLLAVADAQTHGSLHAEAKGGKSNIGYWLDADDYVEWPFELTTPGTFDVVTEIGGPRKSRLMIEGAGEKLAVDTDATGDYEKFQPVTLGRVTYDKAGKQTLILRPDKKKWQAINVRDVVLKPVK